jgi:hypothetical protein
VDCCGLDSFSEQFEVTRTTYIRDASLAAVPFDEAWSAIQRIVTLFARLEIIPFVFPLPGRAK